MDAAVAAVLDGRAGTWTQLQLIEMDVAFCAAMRRAHPELDTIPGPRRIIRRNQPRQSAA
jgi:hypothetical protein